MYNRTYGILSVGLSDATSAGWVTVSMYWQNPTKQYMAKYSLNLYADLCKDNFPMPLILMECLGYNHCGRMYLMNSAEDEISLRQIFSRSAIYEEEA
ncbi:unnamed protein product [Acanthocheilonema viteae]|uniref:Uncharacterized protein n=1 Tax=Acanthocheilonema viteae TaxID=6277 RepID=A0A498RZG6_ACAVI|nr:unnamed protein product [Acanthocheilonema viteae]